MIPKSLNNYLRGVFVFLAFAVGFSTENLFAQSIVGFRPPDNVCANSQFFISFGYSDTSTIQFDLPTTSLGHSDTIFLPDGVPCGTMGCSYRSPVTFTDFPANQTISSVNDIKYVRLKMEHSFIGDLHMNITCPSGAKASLMNFASGSSQCTGSIPASARGWSSGNNVDGSVYFGIPNDYEDEDYPCDASRPRNAPGRGWNYCWSNNTNSGYTYGAGDGIIYRSGNTVFVAGAYNGVIDSSDVARGRNFYHPNQSFSNLIGCPLNGTWFIEVLDGYSIDNGYIFEWELALDPSLIPRDCEVVSNSVSGPYVSRINDSLFRVDVPVLDRDTSIVYNFHVSTTCGSLDTTATISLHKNQILRIDTTACGAITWNGRTYTSSTQNRTSYRTEFLCDSVVEVSLVINPVYNLSESEAVCDGEPTHYGFTTSIQKDTLFHTSKGCDSLIHYSLRVNPVYNSSSRDTICDNQSVLFDSHTIRTAGQYEAAYQTSAGCDSIMKLQLWVLPTNYIPQHVTICNGDGYTWEDGITYSETTYEPKIINPNQYGCDSIRHLMLEVNNSFRARMRFSPKFVNYENNIVRLEDISHGRSRKWKVLDMEDTNLVFTFPYPLDLDSVEVQLSAVSPGGCPDDTVAIIRSDLGTTWVPNVFTPGESQNRLFLVESYDVIAGDVFVYDRKGMFITQFDILTGSWDGTFNGKPAPQGVYIWTMNYTTKTQPRIEQKTKGTVLLLR